MTDIIMIAFMSYSEGLTLQYVAVGVIVLIAVLIFVRMIVRSVRRRSGGICAGCALADSCHKKDKGECHECGDCR
ncbi:MAG: hypothetical protein NC117_05405 [Pseudoflavonifractor sp.]|nr:hypothetical protein [Pseudoflavonifractor sp.]